MFERQLPSRLIITVWSLTLAGCASYGGAPEPADPAADDAAVVVAADSAAAAAAQPTDPGPMRPAGQAVVVTADSAAVAEAARRTDPAPTRPDMRAGAPAVVARPTDPGPTRPALQPIYDRREPEPIEAGVAPLEGEYATGVDVLSYDVELALSDTSKVIYGKATIEFELTGVDQFDAAGRQIAFDFTGLAVHAASVDGRPTQIGGADGKLFVPVSGGGLHTVVIEYQGTPDDGLVIQDNVHGEPTVFADNWPNRARFWFPSMDHPADKATLSFTIHAPERWEVISNGALAGEPEPARPDVLGGAEGKRTWRWQSDVPHPVYTMVIGAADFEVLPLGLAACGHAPASPREDGCIEVSAWVFVPDTHFAAEVFSRAAEMTDYYTELFGDFPYEKLAHVQSSTRFGGMENSSAIFYSEAAIAEGRLSETTVAHEIVHQWFGDSATEADWNHLWLSEGFATYFAYQFFLHADGEETFQAQLEGARQRVLGSDASERPIIDPEEKNLYALLNSNNYPKGGWVLHMLRGMLGDEVFFRGVRTYYQRHANGTALTADFQAALQEVSGQDLGWFFEQWVMKPGFPKFSVDWTWDEGTGKVTVEVSQVQSADWPTFRVPVMLELVAHDEENARVVGQPVEITDRVQTFEFSSRTRPSDVILDPGGWILKEMVGETDE